MGSLGIHLGLGQWFISYLSSQRLGHGSLHRFFTFIAWQWIQLTQRCRVSPLCYFAHILLFPKIPPSNFFFFFSDSSSLLHFTQFHETPATFTKMYQENPERESSNGISYTLFGPQGPFYLVPLAKETSFPLKSFRSLSYCTASMVGLSMTMRRAKKKDSPVFFSWQGPFFPDPLTEVTLIICICICLLSSCSSMTETNLHLNPGAKTAGKN